MKNKLLVLAALKIVKNVEVSAVVKVEENQSLHPSLNNFKCHQNTAWHAFNNRDVIAVAEGFYLDHGQAVAHFICLSIRGHYFDVTVPTHYLDNKQFHIVKIHTVEGSHNADNAGDNLMRMKSELHNSLPWYLKMLLKPNSF